MNYSRFLLMIFSASLLCFAGGAANTPGQDRTNPPQVAVNIAEDEDKKSSSEEAQPATQGLDSSTIMNRVGVQQDRSIPLSLNDAIRTALENNNQIEISRADVRVQETRLQSLLGTYDPVFRIQPTYTRNSTTGSRATSDFRGNADFTGLIRRGGGDYSVFLNNTRTENAFSQAQLSSGNSLGTTSASAIYSSNIGFNYNQPLLRDFKVDNNRRLIKIQRKTLQQTDAEFRRQTIDVISQVQQAYWDLVFALRDQQNRTANLNLAKENLQQIDAKIEAGVAAPLARAEVATELANREGEVLLASQQVSITENTLKTLLIRNPDAPEWSESYVPTDAPVLSLDAVNLADALKDATENRPELARLKFQKEINDIDLVYYKNQTKPQIDLNSSLFFNGLAQGRPNTTIETSFFTSATDLALLAAINNTRQTIGLMPIQNVPITIPPQSSFLFGGFNRSFANIFRSDAFNYSVGVTISFPFKNRTAKANLAGARVQQEQIQAQTRQQEQVVIADVRNAVQAVETARLRVLTSRRARENAEIQLEGERQLFDVGRSTTFLLFQRENSLTNARNSEIRAETDYSKALSDLQRATSTTFRANNIEVESPMTGN